MYSPFSRVPLWNFVHRIVRSIKNGKIETSGEFDENRGMNECFWKEAPRRSCQLVPTAINGKEHGKRYCTARKLRRGRRSVLQIGSKLLKVSRALGDRPRDAEKWHGISRFVEFHRVLSRSAFIRFYRRLIVRFSFVTFLKPELPSPLRRGGSDWTNKNRETRVVKRIWATLSATNQRLILRRVLHVQAISRINGEEFQSIGSSLDKLSSIPGIEETKNRARTYCIIPQFSSVSLSEKFIGDYRWNFFSTIGIICVFPSWNTQGGKVRGSREISKMANSE